jgi:hypothetical protein
MSTAKILGIFKKFPEICEAMHPLNEDSKEQS